MEELHRPSQSYSSKSLWALIISDDEQGRVEQFIISKTKSLPTMKSPVIRDDEQKTLLGKLSGKSTWQFLKKEDFGPTWIRKDEQAYAIYLTERRWLIVMNRAGFERQLKSMNMQLIEEPKSKLESPH